MPKSVSGTTLSVFDETAGGLIIRATIDNGTPPTTASLFAVGAKVIDLSTGTQYSNVGTTAIPVWQPLENNSVQVSLTAANLIAMYTTPVAVVTAVANKSIIVDSVEFDITRTATAFTGGGVVAVQYDSTANGAGTATHATIAATVVTGAAGRTVTARIPVVQSDIASASIVGKGLYISNATAAFAAGTGTAVVTIRYHLV